MSKLTLNDITSGFAAATKVNANNTAIEEALENTLSRDGSSPNQMEANLDMNGNRVLNVGAPGAGTDAARFMDIAGAVEVTGIVVPSQTGNAGKALKTDGTTATWAALDLDSVGIEGNLPKERLNSGTGATSKSFWRGDESWAERPGQVVDWPFTTLTDGATITVDCTLSKRFDVTLGGNRTIVLSNPVDGQSIEIWFKQDGTGSRTITWPATVLFEGGSDPGLPGTAGQIDKYELTYNSDENKWFATPLMSSPAADIVLNFTQDNRDIYLFPLAGSPSAASTVQVNIYPGVTLQASDYANYAVDTSGFPSGTVINITNQGNILAAGGNGGQGGSISTSAGDADSTGVRRGQNGRPGGNAVKGPGTGRTLNITNAQGKIWGGGGGGGGGGASADGGTANGGGGGAGAGGALGGFGAEFYPLGGTSTNGADGTNSRFGIASTAGTGGAAGTVEGTATGGAGGAGGDWGTAGSNGVSPTTHADDTPGGTGGAAGKAVDINSGTVNIVSGSSSPNVKGAVS